jgi:MFS family permease
MRRWRSNIDLLHVWSVFSGVRRAVGAAACGSIRYCLLLGCCFVNVNQSRPLCGTSAGWIGIVQISGHQVPFSVRGRTLAILTLSYTIGDVVSRWILGGVLALTTNWRHIMLAAAGLTFVTTLPVILYLRHKLKVMQDQPNVIKVTEHSTEDGQEPSGDETQLALVRSTSVSGIEMISSPSASARFVGDFWSQSSLDVCRNVLRVLC